MNKHIIFLIYVIIYNLDFSIYDYSRSAKDSPRNNLRTTSKLTRECKSLLDEQDWYEKDLSDFDEPQVSDEEHEGLFKFSFFLIKFKIKSVFICSSTTNHSNKTTTTTYKKIIVI